MAVIFSVEIVIQDIGSEPPTDSPDVRGIINFDLLLICILSFLLLTGVGTIFRRR